MADLPIVCTLTPDALRARRAGLLLQLLVLVPKILITPFPEILITCR